MSRFSSGLGPRLSALVMFFAVAAIAGVVVAVAVTPAAALTGTAAKDGIGLFEHLPSDLQITPLDQKTRIYAKSGGKEVQIAAFYTEDRTVIPWSEVTPAVKDAAVAGEDVRFYQHGAVDPTGILRAAVSDALGRNVQGASTITQQYVKNVCIQQAEQLSTQKAVAAAYHDCTATDIGRKLREARYAIGLEKRYSKDQILLGYLNIAGFGGQIYGIQAAARYYYGIDAKDLSVAQAASLIAIVNDPEVLRIDRPADIPADTARRNYILRTELQQKMLTATQYAGAVASPVKPRITPPKTGCRSAGAAGFFCSYVVDTIEQNPAFGRTAADRFANLQTAGWRIYTTLNLDLEKQAQAVMHRYVPATSKELNIGGAAVSVEVGTGRIVTMVENKAFDDSGSAAVSGGGATAVNFTTDEAYGGSGGLQPGSTYKLFTLLDWLKTGHTLSDSVLGSARTIPASSFTVCGQPDSGSAWSVGNDEGERGHFSVLAATERSINGAFASMGEQLDLCDIRAMAESFDVHPAKGGRLDDNPSSIIGTNYVSPLSMATAYAGMGDLGRTCTPVAIEKVVKPDGSQVKVPATSCHQSVDKQVAIAADAALRGVVTNGTAGGDQTADGVFELGKTGTTDGNANTWMIGTTSKVATAVWVGNVSGYVDLRSIYDFPTCPIYGTGQAAIERHCLWRGIQTAVNRVYGGATTWPSPEQRFVAAPAPAAPPAPAPAPAPTTPTPSASPTPVPTPPPASPSPAPTKAG
ncbi:MAG: transglycosylase domain-containing protein [Amnibacterium sp.]